MEISSDRRTGATVTLPSRLHHSFWARLFTMAVKARRIDVMEDPIGIDTPDYATAFEIEVSDRNEMSPEQWIRKIFEAGPTSMRVFVLLGWKGVLGFRLGPRPSPSHVLGWKITNMTSEVVAMDVSSPLMSAHKVLRLSESRIVLTTFVRYNGKLGRTLWSAVAPIHHRTEPYLLAHAVNSPD